jgi:hypothetical protein
MLKTSETFVRHGVRELQSPFQLGLQDAVFGDQIFVPRRQLLVHHPGDVSQDACPRGAMDGRRSMRCAGTPPSANPCGCARYDVFSIVGAVSLAVSGGVVLVNLPQVERLVPG